MAQQAMLRGDWEAFFPCLANKTLERFATLVMPLAEVESEGRFTSLCREHGISDDLIDALRVAGAAVTASAARMQSGTVTSEQMLADSRRHRDLVKAHLFAARSCVRATSDVAAFVAASERFRRDTSGGGSISSRMFVDETLTDVVITGKKATGVRRFAQGGSEGVSFVIERGEWRIGGATRT